MPLPVDVSRGEAARVVVLISGTGTLLRLAWRRDRVLIPVSLLALTVLSVGSGQATLALYPNEAAARDGLGSVLATDSRATLLKRVVALPDGASSRAESV